MPAAEAWLVLWLTFSCPWVLDKVPFALKPLACSSGANLEVRILRSKEEAERVLQTAPESRDFAWVFRAERGRIVRKPVRFIAVVDP